MAIVLWLLKYVMCDVNVMEIFRVDRLSKLIEKQPKEVTVEWKERWE